MHCSNSICNRLAYIFNTSFTSGRVPSDWKISRVVPVFKKGDTGLASNYRPISLLSLVGKIQERLVHNSLLEHLLDRDAISPHQFGFWPGSSTQEALISLTQSWHQHLEDGHSTICAISEAFDSVPHSGIMESLSEAGVGGPLLGWFQDYLTNTLQSFVLQGSSSPSCLVSSGIPQGSILGPLLFILAFSTSHSPAAVISLDMLMMPHTLDLCLVTQI